MVERPQPTQQNPHNLALDKGYDNPSSQQALEGRGSTLHIQGRGSTLHIQGRGSTLHIRRIGEEKFNENKEKKYPARRGVVERTLACLSRCRAILVRYDKKAQNYLALLKLACALLGFRRAHKLNAF